MPISPLAAVNIFAVFGVLLAIPIFGTVFYFVGLLVFAPIQTIWALLQGKKPDEDAATIAFWEAIIGLVVAAFALNIVKL